MRKVIFHSRVTGKWGIYLAALQGVIFDALIQGKPSFFKAFEIFDHTRSGVGEKERAQLVEVRGKTVDEQQSGFDHQLVISRFVLGGCVANFRVAGW